MHVALQSWQVWDTVGELAVRHSDTWECCVAKRDLDREVATGKWYMLYDVGGVAGASVCASAAYNLVGVPSLLFDGPQPRTMLNYETWVSPKPLQLRLKDATRLDMLRGPSARSWRVDAALVGGGPEAVVAVRQGTADS